jgi:uncharacterized protein (TIRG00374 family)
MIGVDQPSQTPLAIGPTWRGSARIVAGLVVSIGLLLLAVSQVDFPSLSAEMGAVNYLFVAAAISVYFVDLAIRAIRWRVLLSGTVSVPARRLYPVLAIGYMANNLLPVRIGEISRAYLVGRREQVDASAVFASVAVERILDGLTVVVLLVSTLPFLPLAVGGDSAWLVALARISGATFGAGVVIVVSLVLGRTFWLAIAHRVLGTLPDALRSASLRVVEGFVDGLESLKSPRRLAGVLVLSIVVWIVGAATYFLTAQSFGITLNPIACLTSICVVNLATAVPLAPAGLGAFEAAAQRMFVLLGASLTAAFGVTILLHAVLFFPVVVVGLACLWRAGFSLVHLWDPSRAIVTTGRAE